MRPPPSRPPPSRPKPPIQTPSVQPRNTPIIKAIEVRLIEKRCRALYSSPDAGDGAGERQRAFAVLQQLQMVRSQKAKARIPEPTWRAEPTVYTSGSSAELNTRMLAERASMRFEEKDRDGDLTLDFEEFHANFPRLVREAVGVEGIRRWFDEADTDGDKTLTKNEFFAWCMKHGQGGLHDKFAKFDRLQTGSLDYNEFERLCASVGFGGEARKIFPSLDEERRGVIKLEGIEELVKRHSENRRLSARAKEMLCMVLLAGAEAALSAEGASDLRSKTKDWAIRARDAAGVRVELHALLSGSGAAIVDVMALFNSDREQLIDEMEFQTTLKTLFKCHAKPWELDAVFESIDLDRSGSIGFDELFEFVRGRRHAHDRRSLVVRRLSLQPPPGAAWALGDIEWDVETFRSLLRQNFKVHDVKVADVIKAWDRSGDGQLSESEYLHHMELFFMSSSAAASMALRQLWQQEVRSVALSAFHVVAAIDRNGREEGSNDEVSVLELERWLSGAAILHPRLKPRAHRSEAAKHLGLAGDQKSWAVPEALSGALSADPSPGTAPRSSSRLTRILDRSTRSMLLKAQHARSKASEQRRGAEQWEQWQRQRHAELHRCDSSPTFMIGQRMCPSSPPNRGDALWSASSRRPGSAGQATEQLSPQLGRFTRMEAMAGALQAKLLNSSTSFVKLDDRGRPIVPHGPIPLIAQEERHARRARPSEKEAHVVLAENGLSGGAISQVWSIPTRGSPAARE
eukprot:jgi/Chrpa1/2/Chrysochromulina_OHIO_Genome00000045-RA